MSLATRIAAGLPRVGVLAVVAVATTAGVPSMARADTPVVEASAGTQALVARLGLEESATPVRERKGWSRPRVVLVANAMPEALPALQAVAPGVKLLTADSAAQAEELASQADAVIGFCTPAVLEAGRRIRWVQVMSAGVEDCVAVPALRSRDILLTNMQRVAGPVMAEHVLAMMFAFARGLDFYIPERLERRWTR